MTRPRKLSDRKGADAEPGLVISEVNRWNERERIR